MRRVTAVLLPLVLTILVVVVATARDTRVPAGASESPGAAALYTGIDTVAIAAFDFDDGLGGADPQGWTSVDIHAQVDTFFHVDDFAGMPAPYSALEGTQSLWCGARDNTGVECAYATLPGYGSNWRQVFQSRAFTTTGDVTVSCLVQHDIESGYDWAYLEYYSQSGVWQELASYTGNGSLLESVVIPADSVAGSTLLRFRFESDYGYDDRYGHDTDGAIIIDSLLVSDGAGVVDYQDFETEAVGALTTTDGDWEATVPASFGDYTGLFDGSTVLQEDSLVTNTTHLWGFFNGSTDDYSCGGHPEQPVVPFTLTPGSENYYDYVGNGIVSPSINLAGILGPPDSLLVEFDVYLDLPRDNVVYYTVSRRFLVDGVWTCWDEGNLLYWNSTADKEWFRFSKKIYTATGATDLGVRLEVLDYCHTWCGVYGDGTCHSHAPLFDNVRVLKLKPYEYLVTNTNDSGPGSLRQAMLDVNSLPGSGIIAFDIPGPGPHIIQPVTPLPTLTVGCEIDGYTQTGAVLNTNDQNSGSNAVIKVFLDGSQTPPGTSGINAGAGLTLRGLAIGNFPDAGVRISGSSALLAGNFIGTDATGTQARPNGAGIVVESATLGTHVGGSYGDRNVISGNAGAGIEIDERCNVEGNLIGTAADGVTVLANGGAAVLVTGGTLSGVGESYGDARNTIAYDGPGGVVITGAATECKVLNNRIWTESSTGLGIDLGGDGVTANDAGDSDSGPNLLLNYPEITSVTTSSGGSQTHILGQISGAVPAVRTYQVQFFVSPTASPRQATLTLGGDPTVEVTTDASGYAPIDVTISGYNPPDGWWLTATATYGGITSEFSEPVQIMNTQAGTSVGVDLTDPDTGLSAYIEFDEITGAGSTTMSSSSSGPAPPSGFAVNDPATYFEITTDATYLDSITVCLEYDEAAIQGSELDIQILHYDTLLAEPDWVDITRDRYPDLNYVCGRTAHLSPFVVGVTVTSGVNDTPALPSSFALRQNVPNPFNPTTTIAFDVPPGAGRVTLAVYDVAGRLVRTLVDGELAPGYRRVEWDGRNARGQAVASGVYFYRMVSSAFTQTRKMVLLK